MSTDAIQGKSAGKERIKNAIFSLVLIIAAWLILYTINPNLLTLNLNISAVTTTAPAGVTLGNISTPGTPMTQEDIANSNLVRTGLALGGVNTYRDPCTEGQTTNCVNLNGLTNVTTTGLIALKQDCTNCSVLITGGTEGGHSENSQHYTGSAVDLNPNVALDSYITTGHTPTQTAYGPVYTLKINGQDVTFLNETVNAPGSTGAHWHVTFH